MVDAQVASPARRLPGARPALMLLLAINLFNYLDRMVISAVEPEIRASLKEHAQHFGQPLSEEAAKSMTGWLASAFILAYMLGAPLFGFLADRMSRWVLVGIGVGLWSLASGATGLATTFAAMLVARLCVGIGEAAYGPAAPTIISDLYPVQRRGTVLAWFYMAIPVGAALGYAFGGFFTQGGRFSWFYGWHGAFYCVVFPGLIMAVMCFFMKDPPRGQADAGVTDRRAHLRDYLVLFKTPSYVLDTAGMAAMTFAIGGIQFWMPAYLSEYRHAGPLETVNLHFGIILAVAGLSATLLGGLAGDRLRGHVRGAYFLVSGAGLLLAVLFVVLMLFSPFPLAWLWIFLAVFWLFFNTGPANTALANVVHPSMRATAFALNILLIHLLGDVPAPPLLGAISAARGWNAAFGLVAAAMALGGVLWLCGMRFLDRDTERAPLNPPGFEVMNVQSPDARN